MNGTTKGTFQILKYAFGTSTNEKATAKLLRTIGFYMPIELQKSGYIGSIFYDGQKVNIIGEKFSDFFAKKYTSDDQVDTPEDGNLLNASKTKAPTWFTSKGLQLPKLVQTIIDANTTVQQRDGSVKTNVSGQRAWDAYEVAKE
jgi:hypothetical protein